MESKFVSLLVEWGTKHDVKLANTFCKEWEPTRAKTNRLDFWRQSEVQFQKWKIMDLLFPSSGEMRSVVARNGCAQNLSDHWPVLAFVRLPEKKERWRHEDTQPEKDGNQKQKVMKLDLEE